MRLTSSFVLLSWVAGKDVRPFLKSNNFKLGGNTRRNNNHQTPTNRKRFSTNSQGPETKKLIKQNGLQHRNQESSALTKNIEVIDPSLSNNQQSMQAHELHPYSNGAAQHPVYYGENDNLLMMASNNNYSNGYAHNGQVIPENNLFGQFDHTFHNGDQFQMEPMPTEHQPQNTVAAVAAASLLLANCYDGVLLQPSQQTQPIKVEGIHNNYNNLGFYPNQHHHPHRIQFNDSSNLPSSTDLCQNPFDSQHLLNCPTTRLSIEADNNNVSNSNMQSVQDPQQAQNTNTQIVAEKIDLTSVTCPQQCFACNEQIQERFMLCVDQHYYHANCLRCCTCGLQLDDYPTCYWKHDQLYCKGCYIQKFQIKCAHCDRHIQAADWVRRARTHVYHLACFSCNHCKRQLSTGEQFSLQDSKLLCKQHYLELVEGQDAQQKSKAKRVRTTFAEEQLSILQAHFQMDCNPDGADLERIANQTGLSKRVTQVWFQNSRARQKKYQVGGKKSSSNVSTDHQSDTAPLGSSCRSSPTTTIDSSMSPMTKSPSMERHSLMLTSDHILSAANTVDASDYMTSINL